MKLSEFKQALSGIEEINFILPNKTTIPRHFHITEIAMLNKRFIDCGGTVREENNIGFQLWFANDLDHRLEPAKLIDIINTAEDRLDLEDLEIEVEYQSETIGKYGLTCADGQFFLTPRQTDCLAPEKCNIPVKKQKIELAALHITKNSCEPGSGCC